MVIFVFYLILVAFIPVTVSDGMGTLCFVISIASLIVYFIVRDLAHPALWVSLYLGISVLAFYTEQVLEIPFWGMTSPRSVVNFGFLIAAILIALKIIFRKPNERFLTTSLEVLLIGMVLSLKILSPEMSIAYSLPAFMFKMIVLLLGFKILAGRSKSMLKYQFFTTQGILLSFFLRGLWM